MTQRINYIKQSPELFKKYLEFSTLLDNSAIEASIRDLVEIRAINGWNRVNVAFRTVPGSSDKAYGLDKANLE
ncbi:hypothetical protein Tamer19_20300 [Cupriavidus sp. TA19]|uniref:hypothetical protein n=1 Tax=unclassified Cupriavidus TaxID=2640874 RepID=UPI0027294977|nr:hypothetical protein [Cupriavidus sp. TA19]GLC92622.1 hypothetical protein Tamer19_20300 [Cupriavidus sp. TA19]